jgi:hypothetical protein
MPVEVKISFADNTDTLIRIINDMNPQVFQWMFSKEPLSLSFDPNRNILLKQAATIVSLQDATETGYNLYQNEPNPFTESSTIKYNIPAESDVKISIFDSKGREIAVPVNKRHSPGKYQIDITNELFVPGIYFYQLESGNFKKSRKMIVVN